MVARSYSGEGDNDGRKKGANGVNPDLSRSIYRGPLDLPVVVLSTVQRASTALSQ
jgi:hypothetical protein